MAYFTRTDVVAEIPAEDLVPLLDDDRDGSEDSGLFDALVAAAQERIDALLEPRYAVPWADGAVPRLVKQGALLSLLAGLYRRRGTKDADNPFAEREQSILSKLERIADGTGVLDAATESAGAAVYIEEPDGDWDLTDQGDL